VISPAVSTQKHATASLRRITYTYNNPVYFLLWILIRNAVTIWPATGQIAGRTVDPWGFGRGRAVAPVPTCPCGDGERSFIRPSQGRMFDRSWPGAFDRSYSL